MRSANTSSLAGIQWKVTAHQGITIGESPESRPHVYNSIGKGFEASKFGRPP